MKKWRALFALGAALFLVFCKCQSKAPPRRVLDQVSYQPQNGIAGGGGRCRLCAMKPLENNTLAFLSINSRTASYVELARTDDGAKKSSGYTMLELDGPPKSGCAIRSETCAGRFQGTIYSGKAPAPSWPLLRRYFCLACRKSLVKVLGGYDTVLVDLQSHIIYKVCGLNRRFELRHYRVETRQKPDGNFEITILNQRFAS